MKIGKLHLKKIIVIAIVAFILFSIFRYCVKNSIIDAAVNEQTGAITILNRDYELKTYDRYGNMIYDIKLLNTGGGYAHLDYEESLLIVHVLRTDEIRKYDEGGKLIEQQVVDELITYAWDNWQRDSKSFSYETNTHVYRYTYPMFWRYLFIKDEVIVKMTDKETQKEIILWKQV